MKRSHSIYLLVALLFQLPGIAFLQAQEEPDPSKPNIVFILIDDLGWTDTGIYGNAYHQTPRIDSIGKQGMLFSNAYSAAPVCSPTRAAIMTGKYPARLHLTDWLPGRPDLPDQKLDQPEIVQHLPLEEITIAEQLKEAGYTTAHIGKWHLGGDGFGPEHQGFDINIAGDHTGTPLSYFAPFKGTDHRAGGQERTMPGLEDAPEGEYLTDRLTEEAVQFIEQHAEEPFFLYLSHYAVHIPMRAKEGLVDKYRNIEPPDTHHTNAIYAAMLESVDQSVGRVLDKLDSLGIAENTLVIFTSDNGGLSVTEGPHTPATSNFPLKGGKGFLHEGGIRVPLLMRWPGVIRPGSLGHTPVCSIDFFPTLMEAAGVEWEQAVDGVSLMPMMREDGELPDRALFWHYPHYSNQSRKPDAPEGGGPATAMREGAFKYIQYEERGWGLFDVNQDIQEAHDLSTTRIRKFFAMARALHVWKAGVDAQRMRYNTNHVMEPIRPSEEDRSILLLSSEAAIHGEALRYEPEPFKDTLGYWTNEEDWVSWRFEVPKAGRYSIMVSYGCGPANGGSLVDIICEEQTFVLTVEETGHWQNWVLRKAGRLKFDQPGIYTLEVRPRTKALNAVMDLQNIRLVPDP